MVAKKGRKGDLSQFEFRVLRWIIVVHLVLCLISIPRITWAEYTYTEILPPGSDWLHSQAHGINDKGAVVGYVGYGRDKAVYKGFIYSDGSYTELLPPGWREAYAYGINDRGAVVGYGRDRAVYKGFLYSDGSYTELLPPGWREAYAYGINNKGAVVGWGYNTAGALRGFIYSDGSYIELLPPGWRWAEAHGINDSRTVVGYGSDMNNIFKGFIYSNGSYAELLPSGWRWAEFYGINNRGAVVGRGGYEGSAYTSGFIYNSGSYTILLPSGWRWTQAYDINDSGVIVGYGSYGSDKRGFIAMGVPDIAVSPLTIYFGGNFNAGPLSDQTLTIKNTGAGELIIGRVTSPSFPFSIVTDNCSGQTLAPLATCTITYRYLLTSAAKMLVSDSNIPSNDPDENPVTVSLGVFPDNDGDGYTLDVDCDDRDPSVNPGASEILHNRKDDDCNPATSDTATTGIKN